MRSARQLLLPAWLGVAAAGAGAEPIDYASTPTHTFVNFEVLHNGLSTRRGRFNRSEARIMLDRSERRGEVEFTVQLGSVDSGDVALDALLRTALGVVDSEARARFVSRDLRIEGDRVLGARGELTLRGRTGPLEVSAENFNCYLNPLFRRQVCGGDFQATLVPGQWGIAVDPALGWAPSLKLRVQIEAVAQ